MTEQDSVNEQELKDIHSKPAISEEEIKIQKIVSQLREEIEKALRAIKNPKEEIKFKWIDRQSGEEHIEEYFDKLSVHGSSLLSGEGIEYNDFLTQCANFTDMVTSSLDIAKIPYKINTAKSHVSIIVERSGIPVYVDPSIGQLVKGYNKIFVGTKKELISTISDAHKRGFLVNLSHYASEDVGSLPANPTAQNILFKFWDIKD